MVTAAQEHASYIRRISQQEQKTKSGDHVKVPKERNGHSITFSIERKGVHGQTYEYDIPNFIQHQSCDINSTVAGANEAVTRVIGTIMSAASR